MEIRVDFSKGGFEMSFIPVDFYSLESIFGQLSVIQIKNLSIGIFLNDNPQEDLYIDLNNINRIFPDSVTNLQPLFSFLHKIEDRESFSVYKLEVDFGKFQFLYDDDSFLFLKGQVSNKEDFEIINSIYNEVCSVINIEE
ncbi:hypothetical protein [uncultured Muribaculum sp.]|uniref:hypothetical protein n=1 Tax=uncultured Muribaculum sp. TaxID=1918613 RepID=UPI0025A5059A|nr:hypothetical protein [uncultured Muribaculum sp.]